MRVLVAEDLYLLRDGLVRLLEAHSFTVVAAVASGPELRAALATDPLPDVSIVDVRLPPTFTDEGLQVYARELLADGAGGVGYLLKDRVVNAEQFLDAVRRVAAGGTAMDPEVIAKLVSNRAPLQRLTPREREVLELMAQGRSNAAIGQRLFLSESAVGKHTANIFAKLDLPPSDDDNRRVLAVLAYLNATP